MPFRLFAAMLVFGVAFGAEESGWDKETKVIATNVALDVAIIGYGFAAWDYGSTAFHAQSEGWFGESTEHGGADKFGHAFTSYSLGSGLTTIFRSWGYEQESAAALGAVSALGVTTIMEIGDGISETYGFSYEDEIMNVLGAGFGWLRQRYPTVRHRLDYRLEYIPSPLVRNGETNDIVTDYSGMKYVLAVKASGFECLPRWIRFFEFQVGYYARGFEDDDLKYFDEVQRTAYVAIGLNVAEILGSFTDHSATHFFNYYQAPYTYLPLERDY